jgi:hypothetical protein
MTQWGLDTLFNPAKRHMDEEKQRLQSTREEVGDSSGGKRIDLESGKVKIRVSPRGAEMDKPAETPAAPEVPVGPEAVAETDADTEAPANTDPPAETDASDD